MQRASSVLVTAAQDFGIWIPCALGTQSSLDGLPGWFLVVGHRQQSYSKSPCKRVMSKCLCSTSQTAHGRAKGVNYRPVALSLKGSRQRTLWRHERAARPPRSCHQMPVFFPSLSVIFIGVAIQIFEQYYLKNEHSVPVSIEERNSSDTCPSPVHRLH